MASRQGGWRWVEVGRLCTGASYATCADRDAEVIFVTPGVMADEWRWTWVRDGDVVREGCCASAEEARGKAEAAWREPHAAHWPSGAAVGSGEVRDTRSGAGAGEGVTECWECSRPATRMVPRCDEHSAPSDPPLPRPAKGRSEERDFRAGWSAAFAAFSGDAPGTVEEALIARGIAEPVQGAETTEEIARNLSDYASMGASKTDLRMRAIRLLHGWAAPYRVRERENRTETAVPESWVDRKLRDPKIRAAYEEDLKAKVRAETIEECAMLFDIDNDGNGPEYDYLPDCADAIRALAKTSGESPEKGGE